MEERDAFERANRGLQEEVAQLRLKTTALRKESSEKTMQLQSRQQEVSGCTPVPRSLSAPVARMIWPGASWCR